MNITKAQFANRDGTAVLVELDGSEQFAVFLDSVSDPIGTAYTEWSQTNETLPYYNVPVNPFNAAEAHIGAHFSTPRLLQMKVWWDDLPHEDTPKLQAVFNWTAGITAMAAAGATEFAPPPHDFSECVEECIAVAQQMGRITQY